MWDNLWDFEVNMTILYYIINQNRNDFMEHRPPWYKTPLIPNTCINTVNILWELGLVSKGATMLQRQKTENVVFLSLLFYIYNNHVLWHFLCIILHEIWQIPFILSTIIYLCKELSILINLSRISVFLYISNSPATIAYPCNTPILFIRIPILLSGLLLLGYVTS